MARTTRSPRHDTHYFIHGEEIQTRQVRGQAPTTVITMKSGKRANVTVGGSKSKRVRQWKRLAKRRASKRTRQEMTSPVYSEEAT
jgi:hypothetical protein